MAELGSKYIADPSLGALCVGREAELAKLGALYRRTSAEGGHAILITGQSGVGKSRLLLEFKRRMRLEGVCVLEGRCLQEQRAYAPFLEIVRDATGYLADLAPSLFHASRSMEIMDGLSGSGEPESELRFDRWQDRRIALYESVGDLLSTVAQVRPPVVILHDIQFGDDATLSLLSYLLNTLSESHELRQPDPVTPFKGLFVLSERRSAIATVGRQYLSGVSHTHLTLQGLDRAGVEAFLTAPQVVNRFVEVTGGNPRQIEALLEQEASDADELLLSRIKALPASANRIAAVLAVLGRPASPRTLGKLANLNGSSLGQAMERLLRAEVLLSSIQDGDLQLSFRSTSDREAVIRQLGDDERQQIHRAIGHEMLELGEEVCAAEHLLNVEGEAQAAEVALRAGERLEIAFAYDRAIDLYERAIARSLDRALRHELEERLCDLLELTGEYERAVSLTERLEERSPESATLQRRIGHLHLQQGDFTRAKAKLQKAMALVDGEGSPQLERALILSDLAEVSYLQGQHQQAQDTVARVLASDLTETPVPGLKARNTLGKVLLEQGDFAEAARIFEKNLEESRAANVIPEEIRAQINLGISHLRRGRYDEAAECYRAGLSAAESSQDYRHRAFCLQNLGVLAHWRRDYTSALQLFHDAIQTFLKLGHQSWLSWLALDLGDLYLELGDVVRAESMLELSTNLVDAKGDSQTPLFAHMLQGKLAAFFGRLGDAERHFQTAYREAQKAGKSDETASAALELSRLKLATGDDAAAEKLADHLTEAPTLKTRAQARALLGEALLQRGDLDGALRSLNTARTLYERAGDPFGLWSVLAVLGEVHSLAGNVHEATRVTEQARLIESRVRKSVPREFVDTYLTHPRRRPLLERIGVTVADPVEAPTPISATGGILAPAPGQVARGPLRRSVRRSARHVERYPRIVGESEEILRVLDLIDKIAPLESTVLIRGESGTGKELVAEAIHTNSPRKSKPFIKVNCGALVESLLLSELFGHERGAFTGASRLKKGRFEVANGGTIFLDEIGDITPRTQVALLRVLQEKEFERVGGNSPIHVDVRIVCATNRNLESMVQDGSFREDLYYRLKAFQIEAPPLRSRSSDIAMLAHHCIDRMSEDGECPRKALSQEAIDVLTQWRWPGNVRELQNVLRSVSLLSDGQTIRRPDFRDFISLDEIGVTATTTVRLVSDSEPTPESAPAPAEDGDDGAQAEEPFDFLINEGLSLHEYKKKIEEECIARALRQTNGNITRAAALLKMKRPRLSQLVKEYGLSG
ncbi:MAG: sigma 54-interacting transcriptional regulator [bacterium]